MPADVGLWFVPTPARSPPGALDRCRAVLGDDERERCDRLRSPEVRAERTVAYAAVRWILSRYADVPPAAWRFARNAYGRPEVAGAAATLRFNLSHTDGLAACAVAVGRDVGVDVEHTGRPVDGMGLARHWFHRFEVAALSARPELFWELWTLKEACCKGVGSGLSLGLDSFAVDLDRVAVTFEGSAAGARWQLASHRPTAVHQAALAVERRGGERVAVRTSWARLSPEVDRASEPFVVDSA